MSGPSAIVFGATGGIGAALVVQLAQSGRYIALHAGGRRVFRTTVPEILPFTFDLTNEASIATAAQAIGSRGPVDLAIVATGMLQEEGLQLPERTWRSLDSTTMPRVFAINTIGPALVAKHFLPLMRRDARSVFAVLSARVGSIGDNKLGGWHSYRASKAALNMLVRNFAIELKMRNPHGIAVAVHPGTVDTQLSRPFQGSVLHSRLFTPEQSAQAILDTLDGLSPDDSGAQFAWDGRRIPD
jgi:NAD(P)-dependent dehydrogenase (short-subunit alcohol dehydrogenase family)